MVDVVIHAFAFVGLLATILGLTAIGMSVFGSKREYTRPTEPPVAIGQRFTYMGVEMLCTRHSVYEMPYPTVVADYFTEHGEMEQAVFPPADFRSLQCELDRARDSGVQGSGTG